MNQTFRNSFYAGCVVAVVFGLWFAQLWGAEKQVRLHSEHFLKEIEQRDWSGAGDFIAEDYRDDWGDDRARVLSQLRLTLRFFTSLTITASDAEMTLDPPYGSWKAKIQMKGAGSEMAPEIIARVNSLTTPFELRWRKESWKPWDWKLAEAHNPALKLHGEIY